MCDEDICRAEEIASVDSFAASEMLVLVGGNKI